MFIHKETLEYLLRPDEYWSPEQQAAEIRSLFLPAWHPVGLRSDLPKPGDFKTLDLLGTPLLLRNCDGEIRTFLNVCSHRHCLLRSEPSGRDERIRCQYHGWEFGPDGALSRVPDGGSFKPFDREAAALVQHRTETVGELVFVTLDEATPLQTFLGEIYPRVVDAFGPSWRREWQYAADLQCNWKIPTENMVESYHVPWVHPDTFGAFGLPREEEVSHEIGARHSTFVRTDDTSDGRIRMRRRVAAMLGGTEVTDQYMHYLRYPNVAFIFTDLFTYAQVCLPVSPASCRLQGWMFSLRGTREGPLASVIARLTARHNRRFFAEVLSEDEPILEAQQTGLAASPYRGLLSIREERVYALQRYIREATTNAE